MAAVFLLQLNPITNIKELKVICKCASLEICCLQFWKQLWFCPGEAVLVHHLANNTAIFILLGPGEQLLLPKAKH